MSVLSVGPVQGFVISKIIKITVDGQAVEGLMTGNSYDIDIEVTKPFQNLITGSHIMIQARGHRSFDGQYGDMRALETLENLYHLGVYLKKHEDVLREAVRPFQQRISDLKGVEEFELRAWQIKEEFFDANLPNVNSLSFA